MFAIRLFLLTIGIILIISLLGYALSKDRRWLNLVNLSVKTGFALIAILLLILLLERLLMVF